jgi:hypothetical protein
VKGQSGERGSLHYITASAERMAESTGLEIVCNRATKQVRFEILDKATRHNQISV